MHDQSRIINAIEDLRSRAPSGFAMAFHIRFTTATFQFQSYPKEWTDAYSQNGYVMQDPTVLWGFTHTGHVRWADLVAEDSAGMFAKAAEHGMKFGFSLSGIRDGSQSIASFTRNDRDFTDEDIAAISEIFGMLQEVTSTLSSLSDETCDQLDTLGVVYTHP